MKHASKTPSKQATLLDLLGKPEGATLHQLMDATGWQAHSVRGFMSAALKKKLGLTITSEKANSGERIYRVAEDNQAATAETLEKVD